MKSYFLPFNLLACVDGSTNKDSEPADDTDVETNLPPIPPTRTLIPNGLPTVFINGNPVPVTPGNSDWTTYTNLCPNPQTDIYHYVDPDGNGVTINSSWTFNNFQVNQNQASFGCSQSASPWYLLNQGQSYVFNETLTSSIVALIGDADARLLDENAIQRGNNQVLIPYTTVNKVGLVSVDLPTQRPEIFWEETIANTTTHHPNMNAQTQGDNLLLEIQSHRSIMGENNSQYDTLSLSHTAVFDVNTGVLLTFVTLPEQAEYDDNTTTLEGTLVSDIDDKLSKNSSDPVIQDGWIWTASSPFIDGERIPDGTIHTQYGPVTLLGHDMSTRQAEAYPLNLLGPSEVGAIANTNLVAVSGYRNCESIEDTVDNDGDYYIECDLVVAIVDPTDTVEPTDTAEPATDEIKYQDMGTRNSIYSMDRNLSQPDYVSFTDEGLLNSGAATYIYDPATGAYIDAPQSSTRVEVSFPYTYEETPAETTQIPGSLINEEPLWIDTDHSQNGVMVYSGAAGDYVVVETGTAETPPTATSYQLPLEESCYEFSFSTFNPSTGEFAGYAEAYSCAIETGGAQVMDDQLFVSYQDDVYETSLP